MVRLILLRLVSFFLLWCSGAARPDPPVVLDVNGNQVLAGYGYFATPVPGSGGLILADLNNSCPAYVVPSTDGMGNSIVFGPENADDTVIREEWTFYVLTGYGGSQCKDIGIWKLDNTKVRSGGELAYDVIGTSNSRFALTKVGAPNENHYQFIYCACSDGVKRATCEVGCSRGLGFVSVGNQSVLGVGRQVSPHTFVFVPLEDAAGASILASSGVMRSKAVNIHT